MIKKVFLQNICFSAFLLSVTIGLQAQPFATEIAAFKLQDSAAMPPKHAIVFVGSSSFTKWTNVQSYFPGRTIINRGFGGSTLEDVIRYADDIIIAYNPKQVVIYCGENDIAGGATDSAVYSRFVKLFNIIRAKLSNVSVAFVSVKPSPSRRKYWGVITAANEMIRGFLTQQKNASYIDVYYPMLSKGPAIHGSYFIQDSLHMNESGYKYWKLLIEPYLIRTK
jgi:lysophospholipase L1-like esterase